MIAAARRWASRTGAALVVCALVLCAFPTASRASSACDQCEDLCGLIDQYQQKEKGIELWRQYASSTDQAQRAQLPAHVTEIASLQKHVKGQFEAWADARKQNDELPCAIPPQQRTQKTPVDTDLITTVDQSCEIQYQDKKLEGQNLKDYEKAVDCKVMSDATIAHEEVHREICMRAYHEQEGLKTLDAPEFAAQNELQAWTKHRDVLRDAIRGLAGRCGWEPTKRQKTDPNAVPSGPQTKAMQARGWKASKVLKRKSRTP